MFVLHIAENSCKFAAMSSMGILDSATVSAICDTRRLFKWSFISATVKVLLVPKSSFKNLSASNTRME